MLFSLIDSSGISFPQDFTSAPSSEWLPAHPSSDRPALNALEYAKPSNLRLAPTGDSVLFDWVIEPIPNQDPDLTGFFWALQSSPEYQSIASVAYLNPQLLQALDTARLLFLAPDVFLPTIEWGLQALIEAIKLTADTHDLDVDEIITTINQLAAASYLPIALS